MNPLWLMRMSRWARQVRSPGQVIAVIAIVIACLAIYGIERYIGWPDWATAQRMRP